MTTITICSSASAYKQVVDIETQLKTLGFDVIIPKTARVMAESGDFDVSHYKTWFGNADDYVKKADYMRAHFQEIERGDAILVANYEKHGAANYIGPNVLMEMGIAFYFNKPIYILNDLPENSPFEEELKGFMPSILHGDLSLIQK